MADPNAFRNQFTFSIGTIGRDMLYTLVSMYLTFYLTDILNLPDSTFVGAGSIMLVIRIYGALNDPFMGFLVDNTKSRFGKFKPWIAAGALGSAVFTILFFTDFSCSAWPGADCSPRGFSSLQKKVLPEAAVYGSNDPGHLRLCCFFLLADEHDIPRCSRSPSFRRTVIYSAPDARIPD